MVQAPVKQDVVPVVGVAEGTTTIVSVGVREGLGDTVRVGVKVEVKDGV
jgi:hypothetical protein